MMPRPDPRSPIASIKDMVGNTSNTFINVECE